MAGVKVSKTSLRLFSAFAKSPAINKKYRLVKPIGEGGMGVVFLAKQLDLDRDVAIKCIRTDTFAGEDGVKRFIREAQVLGSLEHPGIVRVFDVDKLGDVLFIVSEFIDGTTLRNRLKQAPFGFEEALELVRDVADAIGFVHGRNVIHRDIKSENILLPSSGGIKVIDFGLARDYSSSGATITKTGEFLGTAEYMAPEIILAQKVTAQCDVYALGCLLYEVLAGEFPYSGSPMEILSKHMREPFPRVAQRLPQCPPAIDALIQKATAKDPSLRTRGVTEFVADITRWLESPHKNLGKMRTVMLGAAPQAKTGAKLISSPGQRAAAAATGRLSKSSARTGRVARSTAQTGNVAVSRTGTRRLSRSSSSSELTEVSKAANPQQSFEPTVQLSSAELEAPLKGRRLASGTASFGRSGNSPVNNDSTMSQVLLLTSKSGKRQWFGFAVILVFLLSGGYYFLQNGDKGAVNDPLNMSVEVVELPPQIKSGAERWVLSAVSPPRIYALDGNDASLAILEFIAKDDLSSVAVLLTSASGKKQDLRFARHPRKTHTWILRYNLWDGPIVSSSVDLPLKAMRELLLKNLNLVITPQFWLNTMEKITRECLYLDADGSVTKGYDWLVEEIVLKAPHLGRIRSLFSFAPMMVKELSTDEIALDHFYKKTVELLFFDQIAQLMGRPRVFEVEKALEKVVRRMDIPEKFKESMISERYSSMDTLLKQFGKKDNTLQAYSPYSKTVPRVIGRGPNSSKDGVDLHSTRKMIIDRQFDEIPIPTFSLSPEDLKKDTVGVSVFLKQFSAMYRVKVTVNGEHYFYITDTLEEDERTEGETNKFIGNSMGLFDTVVSGAVFELPSRWFKASENKLVFTAESIMDKVYPATLTLRNGGKKQVLGNHIVFPSLWRVGIRK